MSTTIQKTTKRVLTRRGVIWLGQTCNLRCRFCYFQTRIEAKDHPEHPFMTLDKAKSIFDILRNHYGNNAIDIQGGEPTIFPGIEELCSHSAAIGLLPTLITNALVLAKRESLQRLKDSGVRDLLVSVHGLGANYDDVVGVPGAHKLQMAALDNCVALGMPVRFNCVLTKSSLPHLAGVARLAVSVGARAVNFIAFNPFEDQQKGERSLDDVAAYSEVSASLVPALDILRAAGIEANVRYFPLCQVPEAYRQHLYNFQQLPYDLHEWDYASWTFTDMKPQRMRAGELSPLVSLRQANARSPMFKSVPNYLDDPAISLEDEYRHSALIRAREHCGYRETPACLACGMRQICDGFHGDYAAFFGTDEAQAIKTPTPGAGPIVDPRHYINQQEKIVEPEDAAWAL
ncbi:MAG: radical SAM protein [Humidesulfovibrio sp.]|nr:radical SAM protein [Humidesulfovibrio sp.]